MNDEPAFPSGKQQTGREEAVEPYYGGITMRDYFAAKAMMTHEYYGNPNKIAEWSYAQADAMMKERTKES